jgi:hypothetical protein
VSKIKKGSDESLVQDLEEILKNSVTSVYQTYVETLKQNKTFDKQAQMIAYTKARDLIVDSIKPKMKQYLKKHYGDFNTWLQTSIETTVNQVKQQGVK